MFIIHNIKITLEILSFHKWNTVYRSFLHGVTTLIRLTATEGDVEQIIQERPPCLKLMCVNTVGEMATYLLVTPAVSETF